VKDPPVRTLKWLGGGLGAEEEFEMLKQGDKGKEVIKLQESLLKLGYELPKFGADGDLGSETVSAVASFKRELVDLAEEEGVSTELQRLIDALVIGEWKRPEVKPVITPEEIAELVSEMYDAFHPLFLGTEETEHAENLQTALKRLGFYRPELAKDQIDGDFGRGTRRSVQAVQHELELEASGEVDEQTTEALTSLLRQAEAGERWKLPRKSDPEVEVPDDQMALYREIMEANGIPSYFAEALAEQEAGSDHIDADGFVKMRCEFWYQYQRDEEEHPDYEIRYRSYGIMQILDMGHPSDDYTRGSEVGNITNKELRESVAKNIEAGAHLLRSLLTGDECIYDEDDERYYECKQCIEAIETIERDWSETRFHKWRSSEVPSFEQIPCGWAEAIRRYNGAGADAEAYRDEILTRITGAERTYVA
jgi:peptidoglycan hydrolase-like protein with peptidoglycan-binding domain